MASDAQIWDPYLMACSNNNLIAAYVIRSEEDMWFKLRFKMINEEGVMSLPDHRYSVSSAEYDMSSYAVSTLKCRKTTAIK